MFNVYTQPKRRRWMSDLFCIVFIVNFNFVSLSLAGKCATCGDSDCVISSSSCYCKRSVSYKTEKRWDRWEGRFIEYNLGVLHASADCFNFIADEHSTLGSDICPEDPCLYVTFTKSEISTVPINFFRTAPHLKKISLKNSQIQNIQVGAFTGLSELQELQLEYNQLTKIKDGCFNTLSGLKTLDFHNNKLKTIEEDSFLGLSTLEYLDLSRNQLSSIPYKLFNPLENLVDLILSHNSLTVLDFNIGQLKKLGNLYLNHNSLENIEECFENTNLNSLFLQNNAISYLNDSCLSSSVSVLNMANNNIDHLEVLGDLSSLTTLNISNNNISELPMNAFENMRNLIKLDLSRNSISKLKTGVFSVVKNIEYLNLSDTNLYNTDPHVFTPLNNLKILDISNNNLSYWDGDSFIHFDHFEKIFLDGNYFSCDIVSSLIKQSKMRNFSLVFTTDYAVENINGLPCSSFNLSSKNTTENNTKNSETSVFNSKILDDFKYQIGKVAEVVDTNLEKHFDSRKTQLDNLEREMLKKIEISLKSDIKSLNKSISSEFQNFQKMIHQPIKTKIPAPTSEPTSMNVVQNQDSHLNTSIVNLEKKLTHSLEQLTFFTIIGFTSLAIFLVFVKIISCIFSSRRKPNSFELAQEMPILSR